MNIIIELEGYSVLRKPYGHAILLLIKNYVRNTSSL
jgi:hypothetical protein